MKLNWEDFLITDSTPISVWFITGNLPPSYSGAGRNDLLLAPHCVKNGLNITFVAPKYPGDKETQKNGVKILRMPRAEKLYSRFLCAAQIVCLLRNNPHPDIIRIRGFSFSYALLSLMLRKFFPKIKIVVQPAMFGGDDPLSIEKKRLGFFEQRQLLNADAILAMNDLIREVFMKYEYPEERIFEVNNPVDVKQFYPVSEKEKMKLRQQLGLPNNALIILTLGVLCRRKNQSLITRAFKKIFSDTAERNIYLVHVGPTSKDLLALGRKDFIKEAADEEVRIKLLLSDIAFAKHVLLVGNQREPSSYLQASDVLIHASTQEGEANVINEALACGLPCVIPDISLYSRQIPATCGCRFLHGDYLDLSSRLLDLVSNPELRRSLGQCGRKHILSTRSPNSVAIEYVSHLRKIASLPKN
jgi:glycosyltransferase involved in cell wall biosynthesis